MKTLIQLASLFALLSGMPAFAAWNCSGTITVNATLAGTANTSNYPLLVSGTYSLLASTANGGCITNASGYDVEFFSNAGLTTKLNWETVSWAATGAVMYHVQLPTLSVSANTVIYWAAGNAAVTTDQSNKTGTWSSNYVFVHHFAASTPGANVDSTSGGYNITSTSSASTVTGPTYLGNGVSTTAMAGYLYTSALPAVTNPVTLSGWVKASAFSVVPVFANLGHTTGNEIALAATSAGLPNVNVTVSGTIKTAAGTTAMSTGTWYYWAATYDGTTITLYVNGSVAGTLSASGSMSSASQGMMFGNSQNVAHGGQGSLAECRLMKVVESASQITAEYNNQSSPSSFYTFSGSRTSTVPALLFGEAEASASPFHLSFPLRNR